MTANAGDIRPIRVAHVIQNLNYGGMERVLHRLAQQLPLRGFEVHILVLEYLGHFAGGLERDVTLHEVPRMPWFSLIYPKQLASALRRINPDIVHSHSGVWLKSSRAAQLARVPRIVHTDHGRAAPVPARDRLVDGCASRKTDIIIAVSDALARVLEKEVVHDRGKVRVIRNGMEVAPALSQHDRDALRAELGLSPSAQVIGSIGRLEPVKNYKMALRALARILADGRRTVPPVLLIAGDGSERASLEAMAGDLGVARHVRFLGWRPDAAEICGAFDIFTLASTSEGTSISLLEAMGSGVCPVVTDVGGNRAVLGPELEALLVPDNDDAAMAHTWSRLLDDAAVRVELGALSRYRVETAFSLTRMVEEHVSLYHELLSRSDTVRPVHGYVSQQTP